MTTLNIVCDRFGPERCCPHGIAPEFFTDRHDAPRGAAISTDGEE